MPDIVRKMLVDDLGLKKISISNFKFFYKIFKFSKLKNKKIYLLYKIYYIYIVKKIY